MREYTDARLSALLRDANISHTKTQMTSVMGFTNYYLIENNAIFHREDGNLARELILDENKKYVFAVADMSIHEYWQICAKYQIRDEIASLAVYRLNGPSSSICIHASDQLMNLKEFVAILMTNDCTYFGSIIDHIVEYAKFCGNTTNDAFECIRDVYKQLIHLNTLVGTPMITKHIDRYLDLYPCIGKFIRGSSKHVPLQINSALFIVPANEARRERAIKTQNRYFAYLRATIICSPFILYLRKMIMHNNSRSHITFIVAHELLCKYWYNEAEIWAIMHDNLSSVMARWRKFGIE